MFSVALQRLLGRPAVPAPSCPRHPSICPPALLRGRWPPHWREWLTGIPDSVFPEQRREVWAGPGRSSRLDDVRHEFMVALDDVPGRPAAELMQQIDRAPTLHELWHLRLDIFNLVACHHDQAEADQRLAQLNRHFPTRAPRSGFGALTPLK